MLTFEELRKKKSTTVVCVSFLHQINYELFYHYCMIKNNDDDLCAGDIIYAQYKESFRGCDSYYKSKKAFKNQVSINMVIKEKIVNIKIFKDKLNISGIKSVSQICETIKYLELTFKYMRTKDIIVTKEFNIIDIKYGSVMITFKLNIKVNRKNIADFFRMQENFGVDYDPRSHSNINIKYPSKLGSVYCKDTCSRGNICEKCKIKNYTFIIFNSGNVNFFGFGVEIHNEMKQVYEEFNTLIENHFPKVVL